MCGEPYAPASLLFLMYEPVYVERNVHTATLSESQPPLSTVAFYLLHFLLCLLDGSPPFQPCTPASSFISPLPLPPRPYSPPLFPRRCTIAGVFFQHSPRPWRRAESNDLDTPAGTDQPHPGGRPMGLEDDRERKYTLGRGTLDSVAGLAALNRPPKKDALR